MEYKYGFPFDIEGGIIRPDCSLFPSQKVKKKTQKTWDQNVS